MKKVSVVMCSMVLTILGICTILSIQIDKIMTPEVNIVKASNAGLFDPDLEEYVQHDLTLPLSALMYDEFGDYVFMLEKKPGVWGDELTAVKCYIDSYNGIDEARFASDSIPYTNESFAIYPSRELKNGEKVKVREK